VTQKPTGSLRRALTVAALVTCVAGVTACSSSEPGTPPPSGGSSSVSSAVSTASAEATSSVAPAPSIPGTPPPPTSVPIAPPAGESFVPSSAQAGGTVSQLRGTLEAGVESGCVVLTDDSGTVLANLIGVDTATTPLGTSVVVTGKFRQDLTTTCQQGKPFAVASVELP
jgi:hypothetical protein